MKQYFVTCYRIVCFLICLTNHLSLKNVYVDRNNINEKLFCDLYALNVNPKKNSCCRIIQNLLFCFYLLKLFYRPSVVHAATLHLMSPISNAYHCRKQFLTHHPTFFFFPSPLFPFFFLFCSLSPSFSLLLPMDSSQAKD